MGKGMGRERARSGRGGKVKMRMVKGKSRGKSEFVFLLSFEKGLVLLRYLVGNLELAKVTGVCHFLSIDKIMKKRAFY